MLVVDMGNSSRGTHPGREAAGCVPRDLLKCQGGNYYENRYL